MLATPRIEIFPHLRPGDRVIGLWFTWFDPELRAQGKLCQRLATAIEWDNPETSLADSSYYTPPVAMLDNDAATKLMDTLWSLGIRPTEAIGSTGQLAATEKHLQDMRQIAFNKLSVEKP